MPGPGPERTRGAARAGRRGDHHQDQEAGVGTGQYLLAHRPPSTLRAGKLAGVAARATRRRATQYGCTAARDTGGAGPGLSGGDGMLRPPDRGAVAVNARSAARQDREGAAAARGGPGTGQRRRGDTRGTARAASSSRPTRRRPPGPDSLRTDGAPGRATTPGAPPGVGGATSACPTPAARQRGRAPGLFLMPGRAGGLGLLPRDDVDGSGVAGAHLREAVSAGCVSRFTCRECDSGPPVAGRCRNESLCPSVRHS